MFHLQVLVRNQPAIVMLTLGFLRCGRDVHFPTACLDKDEVDWLHNRHKDRERRQAAADESLVEPLKFHIQYVLNEKLHQAR